MPCYYCHRKLTRPGKTSRPTDASKEHLDALGKGGKHDFANIVASCRRCNAFADRWPRELKEALRELLSEVGWSGLPRMRGARNPDRFATEVLLRERLAADSAKPRHGA